MATPGTLTYDLCPNKVRYFSIKCRHNPIDVAVVDNPSLSGEGPVPVMVALSSDFTSVSTVIVMNSEHWVSSDSHSMVRCYQ